MRATGRYMSRTLFRRVGALVLAGCGFAGGAGAEEPAAAPGRAAEASARYREALEAEAAGESERARAAFQAVVAADPEHLAARRALGYERLEGRWLAGDELKRARGLVEVAGRWMTREEADALEACAPKAASTTTVEVPSVSERVRLALTARDAAVRVRAVVELRSRAPDAARVAFQDALRATQSPTRVRAAEALGLLGDARAARSLLAAWTTPERQQVRGHFAATTQRSYVADFDVEVA